jgi:predicted RNase H-like HicB family nuclease
MRYPIAIEPGNDKTAWGVVVPDLPGCFSAGDTMDESISNASEAIAAWIEAVLDDGGDIPEPSPVDVHRKNPEFKGWVWALAEVDPAVLSDKAERINITLPARVLKRVDEAARVSNETRSGFLARAALQAIKVQSLPKQGDRTRSGH